MDDLCPAEWDAADNESDDTGSLDHGKNDDLFSSGSEGGWDELDHSDGGTSLSGSDNDDDKDSDAGEDITGDPPFIHGHRYLIPLSPAMLLLLNRILTFASCLAYSMTILRFEMHTYMYLLLLHLMASPTRQPPQCFQVIHSSSSLHGARFYVEATSLRIHFQVVCYWKMEILGN